MHDKAGIRYQCEKEKIERQLALLLARVGTQDTIIVALHGHGLHLMDDDVSYFLPMDARLEGKKNFLALTGKGDPFR